MLALRRQSPALRWGAFDVVSAASDHLIFRRTHADETLLCAFNFGTDPVPLNVTGKTLAGHALAGQLPSDTYLIQREAG